MRYLRFFATIAAFACAVALIGDPALAKPKKAAKAAKATKTAKAAPPTPAPPVAAKPDAAKPDAAKPVEVKPDPAKAGELALTAAQIADGIFAFYAKQPGVRASFTQVVTKKGLAVGLKREGMAWIKRGDSAADKAGKMRWDYPGEEVFYFCNGETLWAYERRERMAMKVPVKNSQIYQATTYLTGQGNLALEFNLELATSPLPDAYALKLVPKAGTQLLKSLTLVVDKATFAVRASKVVDPIGDTTDLVWRDPRFEPLDDKIFEWTPPAGVTVKDLSKAQK